MKAYPSFQEKITVKRRVNTKLIILRLLEKRELTFYEIQQRTQLEPEVSLYEVLEEKKLNSHLTRLQTVSFIEKRENEKPCYALLARGKNALEEYSKHKIGNSGKGLENFFRWQIVDRGSLSTTVAIDKYIRMFGMSRKGRSKTDKKREIIDTMQTMRESDEFEFKDGKLGFVPLN